MTLKLPKILAKFYWNIVKSVLNAFFSCHNSAKILLLKIWATLFINSNKQKYFWATNWATIYQFWAKFCSSRLATLADTCKQRSV